MTKQHAVGHLSQATVALEGKVSGGGSGIVEVGRDKFSQEIALSFFLSVCLVGLNSLFPHLHSPLQPQAWCAAISWRLKHFLLDEGVKLLRLWKLRQFET